MRSPSRSEARCAVCATSLPPSVGHCPLCGTPLELAADNDGQRRVQLDGDEPLEPSPEPSTPTTSRATDSTAAAPLPSADAVDSEGDVAATLAGNPARSGPLVWEGRVALPVERTTRRRRRGLLLLLVVALGALSGWLLCRTLLHQLLAEAVWLLVLAAIGMAVLSSFGVTRWMVLIAVKAVVALGSALLGASLASARSGAATEDVLVARLDIGGDRQVAVAIDGGAEEIRHGDWVRAVGPSLLGMVRAVTVRNRVTDRRWVSAAVRRALAGVGLLTGVVAMVEVMC